MKTAVLAGATGLIGHHLLHLLLNDPDYGHVIAFARRELTFHPKLRVASFDRLEFPSDADVFSALGTTIRKAGSQDAFHAVDYDLPLKIARVGGRQYVLVSSVDANPMSRNFYLRTKGELEKAIAALPFESIHIFRPSLLLGRRAEFRPAERMGMILTKPLQVFLQGRLRRYRSIEASTVAAAMIAAAGSNKRGKHVYEYDEIRSLASR